MRCAGDNGGVGGAGAGNPVTYGVGGAASFSSGTDGGSGSPPTPVGHGDMYVRPSHESMADVADTISTIMLAPLAFAVGILGIAGCAHPKISKTASPEDVCSAFVNKRIEYLQYSINPFDNPTESDKPLLYSDCVAASKVSPSYSSCLADLLNISPTKAEFHSGRHSCHDKFLLELRNLSSPPKDEQEEPTDTEPQVSEPANNTAPPSATVENNEGAYAKCDNLSGDQKNACKSMVDVCIAASDESAKVILRLDSGNITAENRAACLDFAETLASLGYNVVK
ncbi:MAG: hypothetical protein ABH871_09980 [Pseudomonadota bacterium]